MKHLLMLLIFLALAISCFAMGVMGGGIALLVLGVLFEGAFWAGLFRRKASKSAAIKR